MELIVITPEQTLENEIDSVNELLAHGLKRLHIRKPSFSAADYEHYIMGIDALHHSKLVVHGHFELLDKFGLGGIHLNEAARNSKTIGEQIKGIDPALVSTSFHSWQEIVENDFGYAYVFISPVFNSISKPGYNGNIFLAGANDTKRQLAESNKHCPKIIGLGGVAPGNLKTLQEHGFDGGAMLGAIWNSGNTPVALATAMQTIKDLQGH